MSVELTEETGIVQKVKNKELTKTEKIIYDYIKENPKKIFLKGVRNLAEEINVSAGSIMKFCKDVLELKGYSDLKLQLAEDLAKSNSTKPVVYNSMFESFKNEYEDIYKNIQEDIDAEKFKLFNELINKASKILIYDTDSGGLAKIAVSLMYKKGLKNTYIVENMNLGMDRILDMKDNDVLFILSPGNEKYEGYNQLLQVCEGNIISIIDDRLNQISNKSDLVFYTNAENYETGIAATITYFRSLLNYFRFD